MEGRRKCFCAMGVTLRVASQTNHLFLLSVHAFVCSEDVGGGEELWVI